MAGEVEGAATTASPLVNGEPGASGECCNGTETSGKAPQCQAGAEVEAEVAVAQAGPTEDASPLPGTPQPGAPAEPVSRPEAAEPEEAPLPLSVTPQLSSCGEPGSWPGAEEPEERCLSKSSAAPSSLPATPRQSSAGEAVPGPGAEETEEKCPLKARAASRPPTRGNEDMAGQWVEERRAWLAAQRAARSNSFRCTSTSSDCALNEEPPPTPADGDASTAGGDGASASTAGGSSLVDGSSTDRQGHISLSSAMSEKLVATPPRGSPSRARENMAVRRRRFVGTELPPLPLPNSSPARGSREAPEREDEELRREPSVFSICCGSDEEDEAEEDAGSEEADGSSLLQGQLEAAQRIMDAQARVVGRLQREVSSLRAAASNPGSPVAERAEDSAPPEEDRGAAAVAAAAAASGHSPDAEMSAAAHAAQAAEAAPAEEAGQAAPVPASEEAPKRPTESQRHEAQARGPGPDKRRCVDLMAAFSWIEALSVADTNPEHPSEVPAAGKAEKQEAPDPRVHETEVSATATCAPEPRVEETQAEALPLGDGRLARGRTPEASATASQAPEPRVERTEAEAPFRSRKCATVALYRPDRPLPRRAASAPNGAAVPWQRQRLLSRGGTSSAYLVTPWSFI